MRDAGPDYREDRTNLLSLNRIQIIHSVLLTIVVAAPLLPPASRKICDVARLRIRGVIMIICLRTEAALFLNEAMQ